MSRWVLLTAVLALLLSSPRRQDVADLEPVELLYIYEQNGILSVLTDTGSTGYGEDLETALADLRDTARGRLFLETTDYLILTEETKTLLPDLKSFLRPATEVCMGVDVEQDAGEYLKTHPPGVTLNDLGSEDGIIPLLVRSEERYHFEAHRYWG